MVREIVSERGAAAVSTKNPRRKGGPDEMA
jgi:hypothetical protein